MEAVRLRKAPRETAAGSEASLRKLKLCGLEDCGAPRLRDLARRAA